MATENKKRKVLTETDLLSIVESTEAELLKADSELAITASQNLDGVFDAGIFDQLVKAKKYQASTIMRQGRSAYFCLDPRL